MDRSIAVPTIRLARIIADLAAAGSVKRMNLAEAFSYRRILPEIEADRPAWAVAGR